VVAVSITIAVPRGIVTGSHQPTSRQRRPSSPSRLASGGRPGGHGHC